MCALLYRDAAADRHRGLEMMVQAREWQRERMPSLVPVTELWAARERARRGDRDAAIPVMRNAVDELRPGRTAGVWRLGHRRSGGDAAGAWRRGRPGRSPRGDRPVGEPAGNDGSAIVEITLLRLRALLARARGDDVAHRDLVSRYRAMAESLGFEGHIAWAEAMIEGAE